MHCCYGTMQSIDARALKCTTLPRASKRADSARIMHGPRTECMLRTGFAMSSGINARKESQMNVSTTKATLTFSDSDDKIDLPVYKGSMGPDVIDIRKLYGQTGKFTYDPGFMSTAACNSTITYIDGDKGELLYRGYPIEELAVKADFMETCYALLHGDLPTVKEKEDFVETVTKHTMV